MRRLAAASDKIRAVNSARPMRFAFVMPLLLAALAARAFMPAGFMAGSPDGLALSVTMCSPDGEQREAIEIPGSEVHQSCDYCLSPLLGVSPAGRAPEFFAPRLDPPAAPVFSQVAALPLLRSQAPRAPPHA